MTAHLTPTGRCSECGALQVRYDTDVIRGELVEIAAPCRCMKLAAIPAEPTTPKPKQRREWVKRVDQARRLACICQRCDLPTVGKPKIALYCDAHRVEARAEVQARFREKVGPEYQREKERAYQSRNREKLRKKARAYQRKNRKRGNEYKRRWRKLNRDKVRAQKERSALKNFRTNGDPIKRWREEVAAGLRTPQRARRNRKGERLCVTEGCYVVCQGRVKKCDQCKRREAREAAVVLGIAA